MADCFVCGKHRGETPMPGGEIAGDALAVLSHVPLVTPAGSADAAYLGHLLVEPRRHVAGLAGLTAEEAAAIGVLASRGAAALERSAHAEHVYAAVIGHGVDHLHVHLLPRYPGTPREFWWVRVDEWPDAPRGGEGEIEALAGRLRQAI